VKLPEALGNVYAFTHEKRYFLYGPFARTVVEVNRAAALAFARLRRGETEDAGLLGELEAAGLLEGAPPPQPGTPSGGFFEPNQVSLFLTSACNLSCGYCYAHGGERPVHLPLEYARAAIDHVAEAGNPGGRPLALHLHGGGEPTQAFDLLCACVEHARHAAGPGRPVAATVGTNGVMPAERARWIAANLKEATLSLDGPRDLHDHQRPQADGAGSWEQAVGTAQLWDHEGFSYGVRATVTAGGVGCLPELVDALCCATAARSIKVEPLYIHGRAGQGKLSPPSADEFVSAFLEARRVARAQGRELAYSGLRLDTVTRRFCQAAGHSFCITPRGDLTSCYEVTDPADPRSELFFFGRWDPGLRTMVIDAERLRVQLTLGAASSRRCEDCFARWHCAGDCPAKGRWSAGGGRPDPTRCAIARALSAATLVERLDAAT
jgi:uncharacterized protein